MVVGALPEHPALPFPAVCSQSHYIPALWHRGSAGFYFSPRPVAFGRDRDTLMEKICSLIHGISETFEYIGLRLN